MAILNRKKPLMREGVVSLREWSQPARKGLFLGIFRALFELSPFFSTA